MSDEEKILHVIRKHPSGISASQIGEVVDLHASVVGRTANRAGREGRGGEERKHAPLFSAPERVGLYDDIGRHGRETHEGLRVLSRNGERSVWNPVVEINLLCLSWERDRVGSFPVCALPLLQGDRQPQDVQLPGLSRGGGGTPGPRSDATLPWLRGAGL